ncbi:MAG: hypothetical protein KAG56_10575 [Sulfurovaceae bacterium]|nr:hypothetical protein [Sulfurovaceae bacterium]
MNFEELMAFEKKHKLWEHKLFKYPLWIHCREPLLSTAIMAERKMRRPSFWGMVKSFGLTLKFLATQYRYDKVFFLMERAELLEVYIQEKNPKKILFLNPEQERVYQGNDAISSDFFSLLRFISRKTAYLIFRKKYKKIVEELKRENLNRYIRDALGDALFLKFLSLILSKKNQKIYTGAVIPIGEKFVNALNSFEVQHGVIYPEHIGYIALPEVKNSLLLYSNRYEQMMRECGYVGKLELHEYKKAFLEKKSSRYFPIVIYTQPSIEMQESIKRFFKEIQPKNCFIQKHPKDYFDYEIEKIYFVTATIPSEVGNPIMYTSSIIENFTLFNRDCYIYNFKYHINVENFLEIYTLGTSSTMIVRDSFKEIYEEIMSPHES